MLNILVTGEKGFIGSYLKNYLNKNYNVISFPKRICFKNQLLTKAGYRQKISLKII